MIPQADKQRVADAIRAAEQSTTGEIFCVVADHASRYPLAPFSAAAVLALLIPLWLILFTDESAATIYLVQLAGFAAAAAAFAHPRLRYRLVPRVLQHDRAHLTAMRQFWAQGLQTTPSRTGVLIFAAQAERYATVIADEVIHQKVPADVWVGAVDALTAAIRDGRPADGFVAAIEKCGAVLAEHLPRPPGAVPAEALPDKLVEI